MSTRPAGGPDTVVLIHGLWLNGKSWEGAPGRVVDRTLEVRFGGSGVEAYVFTLG